jgi:hypothetical protein
VLNWLGFEFCDFSSLDNDAFRQELDLLGADFVVGEGKTESVA